MKPLSATSRSLVVGVLLLWAMPARAGSIDFSYSWSIGPKAVLTGDSNGTLNGNSTGSVAFARGQDGSKSGTLDGAAVKVLGAIITTSSSGGGNAGPDHYDTPFTMTLHLKDSASSQSADLTFSATLSGDLTTTSSTLKATFLDAASTATLGGHVYAVRLKDRVVNIQAPNSADLAQINAQIEVKILLPTHQTPEPSALVLTGLALPLLGAAARRRHRGARPARA